jgi:hypothetical protein
LLAAIALMELSSMAKFILLGTTWLNLDKVYKVEMPETPTGEWACRVCTDKGYEEFTGEAAKSLIAFLKKHRVDLGQD